MIFIALVGAVYYLIVGRTKRFAPVVAPSEDDAPSAGPGSRHRIAALTVDCPRTGSRQPPRSCANRAPRYGQIEDWLAGQIATGALAPGDRLPTEHDLAKWFGVSRMTLRHALAELARRGLVTRTVGRHGGSVVAAAKLEQDLTTLAGFSEQLRRHGMVAAPGAVRPVPACRAGRGRRAGDWPG